MLFVWTYSFHLCSKGSNITSGSATKNVSHACRLKTLSSRKHFSYETRARDNNGVLETAWKFIMKEFPDKIFKFAFYTLQTSQTFQFHAFCAQPLELLEV